MGPNRHAYSASFHVVGELLAGDPAWRAVDNRKDLKTAEFEELAPGLSVCCHTDCQLVREPFEGLPLIQVDIVAELPWVVSLPEPE